MKISKLAALFLIVALLISNLGACTANTPSSPSDSGTTQTPGDPSDSGNVDESVEITEIHIWVPDNGTAGSGAKASVVEDAINELTEKEIGVHVNFHWVSTPDLATQFTLAMANREAVDIVVTIPLTAGSFVTYYASGIAMDISSLLDEYGQDIKDIMAEQQLLMPYTMADGGIYGLPSYRMLSSDLYIVMRDDMLNQAGIYDSAIKMNSWSDYAEVMQAIIDNCDTYGVGGTQHVGISADGFMWGSAAFSDIITYDTLGDGTGMIYTDKNGGVSLFHAEPMAVDTYKMLADWANKGYIYPDTVINPEPTRTLMKQNAIASLIIGGEYGIENTTAASVGTPVSCVNIAPGMLSTASCIRFGAVIPTSAQEPEAAMKFLNLAYTSSELSTLFAWGVEGETYTLNSQGEAAYAEGADAGTSGYHNSDIMFGNQFLVLPWEGSGGDFRELSKANFLAAPVSKYMGLTVDTSGRDTLVTAIAAVKAEYFAQITSGAYTDEMYNEFMSKLDSAGIDDYIEIYQAAVSQFLK